MVKLEQRESARRLREQGHSINEICQLLGAAKSSVSLWIRDIELGEKERERIESRRRRVGMENRGAKANQEHYRELRRQYQEIGRAQAREGRKLHLIGCMLYWAEGAKKRNTVDFANSDPHMILIFTRFLREEMGVTEIKIQIHCHTVQPEEIQRIEGYWLSLLHLSRDSLIKTQSKDGSIVHHNTLHNGVCSIRVNSTELVMQIYGAIQEYGGFENPAWLF